MGRRSRGSEGWVGRAASLAVALLAILTLVAGGASHELLHADERGGPPVRAVASTPAAVAAPVPDARGRPDLPAHGCSGHCAAHAADQAPILTLLPAPLHQPNGWRVEASAALRRIPTTGPERPPRA